MRFLVTGGAGFIGSAVVRYLIDATPHKVINLDKLTYAGNLESISDVIDSDRYSFVQEDICNFEKVSDIINAYQPDIVLHLAAESHVDRSLDGPAEFINTNILGTFHLLEACRVYWENLNTTARKNFRFHQVSTDEVFGDLPDTSLLFTETTPYQPSSPYSASKASSDHLVRAWSRSFELPVSITNCSNNYGSHQFPEKLIPHMILSAISGRPLPVYGDGRQVRDWLHVEDHAQALISVIMEGPPGETYNIGGNNEIKNIDVVKNICDILEVLAPKKPLGVAKYEDLITFVKDRPGHDLRYAIDSSKIKRDLGWTPKETFASGLYKTIEWYLTNQSWWQRVLSGDYCLDRLGKGK